MSPPSINSLEVARTEAAWDLLDHWLRLRPKYPWVVVMQAVEHQHPGLVQMSIQGEHQKSK